MANRCRHFQMALLTAFDDTSKSRTAIEVELTHGFPRSQNFGRTGNVMKGRELLKGSGE